MKSRTSFSNLTTFKKDITRFAPVWGLYLIGILMALVDNGGYSFDRFARNTMPGLISSFGVVNLIYAAVCAVMLFGDLFNTRMCYSLHTIPQKRETLFLSHLAAGLFFSFIPNLLACAYLMLQLEGYWFLALYWLLAVTLQFMFFFGAAALSAMLTASRFAMLLVYAGINFVSVLLYWILDTIYLPTMDGVVLNYPPFALLSPVVKLFDWEYFTFQRIDISGNKPVTQDPWIPELNFDEMDYYYQYDGLADGWGYLAILAGAGLLLTLLALLLYKLRHLECAGDFLSFPKLKNAACVIMTVCIAGVAGYLGDNLFGGMELWLLVGILVGFFGSLMLLERRVRVFRKKTFLGFLLLTVVLIASFLCMALDVFGIVRWMPGTEDVDSVILANYYDEKGDYSYGESYYGSRIAIHINEDEDIEKVLTAHEHILNQVNDPSYNGRYQRVVLVYTLESGRTVIRSYNIPAQGEAFNIFNAFVYTPENLLGFTDWNAYVRNVVGIIANGERIPATLQEEFLLALRADCEAGKAVTSDYIYKQDKYELENYIDVNIESINPNSSYTNRNLILLPGAKNTRELMKKPEIMLGYTNWMEFKRSVCDVMVQSSEIDPSLYDGLMEALLADCENGKLSTELQNPGEAVYRVEFVVPDYGMRHFFITSASPETYAWILEHEKTGLK